MFQSTRDRSVWQPSCRQSRLPKCFSEHQAKATLLYVPIFKVREKAGSVSATSSERTSTPELQRVGMRRIVYGDFTNRFPSSFNSNANIIAPAYLFFVHKAKIYFFWQGWFTSRCKKLHLFMSLIRNPDLGETVSALREKALQGAFRTSVPS